MLTHFLDQLRPAAKPEAGQLLQAGAIQRRFAAGEFVYLQGDEADGIYVVCHGCVMLEWHAPQNFLAGFRVAGYGDCFGMRSFLAEDRRSTQARSVMDTLALHLPASVLDRAGQVDPQIHRAFARIVAADLGPQTSKVARNGRLPLANRLAFVLVELSYRLQASCRDDSVLVHFPLTQKDLSNLLDVSQEAVSRALHDLEFRELVRLERQPRRLVIADFDGLVELAGRELVADSIRR